MQITSIQKAIEHIVELINTFDVDQYVFRAQGQGGTLESYDCLLKGYQALGASTLKYHFAFPKEVQMDLSDKTRDPDFKDDKYPLLILRPGYESQMEQDDFKYHDVATVGIILATNTEANYKTWQRDAIIFDPILVPLYELFMQVMRDSRLFETVNGYRLPHTMVKHYFYSAAEAKDQNVYAAYWDAIEIGALELKLRKQPEDCSQPIQV